MNEPRIIPEQELVRAELVLEGNHPWVDYDEVVQYCCLDTSRQWTPEAFAPYVQAFMKARSADI